MKKVVLLVVVMSVFVMFNVQNAHAWGKKKSTTPDAVKEKVEVKSEEKTTVEKAEKMPPVQQPIAPVVQKETVNQNAAQEKVPQTEAKALREKVRKNLDNTSWNTEIFPIAGGGKTQKDALIFTDNKFYSEQFSAKGFLSTNYTLTVKDDKMIIWETMQSLEDGQVIFWRGEINEDMTEMRGVLSKQKSPEESESFTFISKEKSPVKK